MSVPKFLENFYTPLICSFSKNYIIFHSMISKWQLLNICLFLCNLTLNILNAYHFNTNKWNVVRFLLKLKVNGTECSVKFGIIYLYTFWNYWFIQNGGQTEKEVLNVFVSIDVLFTSRNLAKHLMNTLNIVKRESEYRWVKNGCKVFLLPIYPFWGILRKKKKNVFEWYLEYIHFIITWFF